MPKVLVVGRNMQVADMFKYKGWDVVSTMSPGINLVCFTGGEDVCPSLYGEKPHKTTHYNLERDLYEIDMFTGALFSGLPMVGICRGGQFLNVMCGGKLYQDVDSHAIYGTHLAYRKDEDIDKAIPVTSTHHQMMKPSEEGEVILSAAFPGEVRTYDTVAYMRGVEAVIYHRQKVLCFQPHPEFNSADETRKLFFEFIEKHLNIKAGE